MSKWFSLKWHLTFRVIPFVVLIVLLKAVARYYDLEVLSLSPLVGAVVSANIFLVGFLISAVLGDYKESERLPGELACSLQVLLDESAIVRMNTESPVATSLTQHVGTIVSSILNWFHKEERTEDLLDKVTALNTHFLAFEPLTQANFIVRMKQEQNNLRRMITRIHGVRETQFNPAGYAIAEIISVALCGGLIFTKLSTVFESVFFVGFVSFVMIYMVFLIKNLDNPFSHFEDKIVIENVSLKPLHDLQRRLSRLG